MPKICQECEYVAASPMEQQEPPGVPENCPQCGGNGTVIDEPEAPTGRPSEQDAE